MFVGRDTPILYGLNGPGIESRWWRDFPRPFRLSLVPIQPPIQWASALFLGGKATGGFMAAVSKPVWHIPLLCVQWRTPDDGQRNCPKHVEFYSKNKFEKLVHLVGFIIRIYHDARSPERQIRSVWLCISILLCSTNTSNCGLKGPGSNLGGEEIFRQSRPALRPTKPPVEWVPVLSWGKVRPWRAADHSPPSSAAVMEE